MPKKIVDRMICMIPVYMDNHSTTRVDPRVVEAMLPYFSDIYGNAGSMGHAFGEQARVAVEDARGRIASSLGTTTDSIVFTSGATESNNLAISGVAGRASRRDNHWISVRTEHHSVLEPLRRLSGSGHQVTLLEVEPSPNSRAGWLDPQRVADALRDQTCLVSVMLANNEIGVVQPLAEIAHLCHQRGVLLHCDATQAVGKLSLDVDKLGVDLLSFSAHKFYGPKGIGGLVVRRNRPATRLQAQIVGGGQQAGRRSGTLNVPAIVGMACALELCLQELPQEAVRLANLRDLLRHGLEETVGDVILCGPEPESLGCKGGELRLPGNLNMAIRNVDGEAMQMAMPQLAISSGATCASVDPEPSHVLLALGMTVDLARGSLRFGLGRFNTDKDVAFALDTVADAAHKLRKLVR
jgi:cysteine desulfurase